MLNGKVAVITGASRGIGREIAITLAKNNAAVIVNYCGNQKAANEVVETINALGKKAVAYKADVSKYNEAKEMIEFAVNKYGSIDILINNAGITKDGLILKMSFEDFNKVIETNLTGAFNCIKHCTRQMVKQRYGKIVNMSSIVGVMGNSGQTNYAASKAGIIGLTKSLAKELGSRNITVNAIAPGYISTDMTGSLSEEYQKKIIDNIAMKRVGTPSDIANLVEFLVSPKADYITGQVIGVDGGMSI